MLSPIPADPRHLQAAHTVLLWAVSRGGQASAPFASKKGSLTVVYATQLIYTCTTPIRYNHAYTHYTRQPKVPHALTGGGRRHLGALHPKDNKRQDKTRQGKNLDRWSVRKLFRSSWPTLWNTLAIGRTPHTGNFDRKVGTATILSTPCTYGIVYMHVNPTRAHASRALLRRQVFTV